MAAVVHFQPCHLHANGESGDMGHKAVVEPWTAAKESDVAKLAQFFPSATAVRVAVRVVRLDARGDTTAEDTVIEFGTAREVLFSASLPLEFGDHIRLVNGDGLLDAEAAVVAVQYHQGRTAVAARFSGPVANWVIRT